MNKVIYFNSLFSIYKELLTIKEQEIFSLYYEENYTMAEIASIKKISKSAVGFKIKSVENKLIKYEKIINKQNILEQIEKIISKETNEEIKKNLEKIINM